MSDKAMSLADARNEAQKATAARERLTALFDPDSFVEVGALVKNGCDGTGVITGYGLVEGSPVYAFSQDSTVRNGAVGAAHGSKIKKIYDLAVKTGAPGRRHLRFQRRRRGRGPRRARRLWGDAPLDQQPLGRRAADLRRGGRLRGQRGADRRLRRLRRHERGRRALSDPRRRGFRDRRGQRGQVGVAHIVEKDADAAVAAARRLVSLLPSNNLSAAPYCDFTEAPGAGAALDALAASVADQADILGIAEQIADADSLIELQKAFSGTGAKVALGTVAGTTVGFVAASDSGAVCSGGCSKIARFVAICDSFQIPVVTLVNCEKFAAADGHVFQGGVREAAKLAHVYAEATTPKVAVIVGKAYGSACVALAGRGANADYAIAWPNAVISALAPETAVAFLEGDKITLEKSRAEVEAEYLANEASALAAAARGHIDDVVDPADTRAAVISALDMLAGKRVSTLPKKHGNISM